MKKVILTVIGLISMNANAFEVCKGSIFNVPSNRTESVYIKIPVLDRAHLWNCKTLSAERAGGYGVCVLADTDTPNNPHYRLRIQNNYSEGNATSIEAKLDPNANFGSVSTIYETPNGDGKDSVEVSCE